MALPFDALFAISLVLHALFVSTSAAPLKFASGRPVMKMDLGRTDVNIEIVEIVEVPSTIGIDSSGINFTSIGDASGDGPSTLSDYLVENFGVASVVDRVESFATTISQSAYQWPQFERPDAVFPDGGLISTHLLTRSSGLTSAMYWRRGISDADNATVEYVSGRGLPTGTNDSYQLEEGENNVDFAMDWTNASPSSALIMRLLFTFDYDVPTAGDFILKLGQLEIPKDVSDDEVGIGGRYRGVEVDIGQAYFRLVFPDFPSVAFTQPNATRDDSFQVDNERIMRFAVEEGASENDKTDGFFNIYMLIYAESNSTGLPTDFPGQFSFESTFLGRKGSGEGDKTGFIILATALACCVILPCLLCACFICIVVLLVCMSVVVLGSLVPAHTGGACAAGSLFGRCCGRGNDKAYVWDEMI